MKTNVAMVAYNRVPDVPSNITKEPKRGLLSKGNMSNKNKQERIASPVLAMAEIIQEIRNKRESFKNG